MKQIAVSGLLAVLALADRAETVNREQAETAARSRRTWSSGR